MFIDAHMHAFKGISGYNGYGFLQSLGYGKVKASTGDVFQSLPPAFVDCKSTPEILLGYMDWAGVDKAVLLQSNFYGGFNDYYAEIQKMYPDRFTCVGLFDPYGTYAEEQLKYCVESLGFKSIKLECSEEYSLAGIHNELNYTDSCFQKLYEYAEKNRLTIVIDTGTYGTKGYQPENLSSLLKKYPGVTTVIAHLAFPEVSEGKKYDGWKKMLSLGSLPNVYFDLASLVAINGEDYPYDNARGFIRTAYDFVGAEKLIFGSDAPGVFTRCTYSQSIKYIWDYCEFFSDQDKEKIFCKNAMKVYQIC